MINIIDCGYTEFVKQNKGRRVFCFGGGKQLQLFSPELYGLSIGGIVDNYKGGKKKSILLNGKYIEIMSLEAFVAQYDRNCSVIITCLAFDEIINQLDKIDKLDGMSCYISLFVKEYTECSSVEIHNENLSMIPKKIHYCWFGKGEISKEYQENIKTWKRYCPEYEIVRWDESNYNYRKNLYMSQAYNKQKWAFVSDYARVDILYQVGGIYLDMDVEVIKNLDKFLKWKLFCGFQNKKEVNWGAGFGSIPGHEILKAVLDIYDGLQFVRDDGTLNETPCPEYQSEILRQYGFKMDGQFQQKNDVAIYPRDFFSPLSYIYGLGNVTENTHTVHWYSASWHSAEASSGKRFLEDNIKRVKAKVNYEVVKTSVIVPVYNTEQYLEKCIQSVIKQTQKEIELILVDDGSTDKSGMIIDRYAKKYSFIRAIHQKNQKQGAARNAGLKVARGEYIYFMDSDDYIADNLLEKCYQAARKDNLDFVMLDANTIVEKEYNGPEVIKEEEYDRGSIGIEEKIYSGKEFWFQYRNKGGIYVCAYLFYISAEFLKRNKLFFEPDVYYEDHDWSTKLYIKAQNIRYIPKQMYYRRVRDESTMTRGYSAEHLASCIRLIDKVVKLIGNVKCPDEESMLIPNIQVYILRAKEILEYYKETDRIENILPVIKKHYGSMQHTLENIDGKNSIVELMLLLFMQNLLNVTILSNEEKQCNNQKIELLYKTIFSDFSLHNPNIRIGIYGTGKICNIFLDIYKRYIGDLKAEICFIESDAKEDKRYKGYPLYNVDVIRELGLNRVIIASTIYQKEMIQNIKKYGEDKTEIQILPKFLSYIKE